VPARAAALPVLVAGDVSGLRPGAVVAVAVNGRVAATTRVFTDGGQRQYSAMLPPWRLRAGANDVGVLLVLPGDRLRAIGPRPGGT
jgi:hypothetical protein